MTHADPYTNWDLEIEHHRGQLISSLNTALTALGQAGIAITALTSNQVYDVEFAEGTPGADVATFIADSTRFTRAAYAITHATTERG